MDVDNEELIEFIQKLQLWHGHKTEQLQQIVDHKDAAIEIGDMTIPAESQMAKGIRIGVRLSLGMLGELPFSLQEKEQEEEEES